MSGKEIDMTDQKQTLQQKKLFVFDMDGTIYLGNQVFDFAIRFINHLREHGYRVLFFTNNASHTTEFYMGKLSRLGFSPSKDEIMTSGDVTAEFLLRLFFIILYLLFIFD